MAAEVLAKAAEEATKPEPRSTGADGLASDDIVGTTFFIACNMMLAFTIFFLMSVQMVPKQWKTSVIVASLVTGIAFYNYTFMKETWVKTHSSPTQYRYVDWLITVPLQITEFYFILKGAGPVRSGLGTQMFTMSLGMVFAGWAAENNIIGKLPGFVLGMAAWLYIVYDVTSGESAGLAAGMKSQAHRDAFNYVRLIVSIGWIIYPLGYAIAYIIPGPLIRPHHEGAPYDVLNIVYNLADLVNKGAFGLAVYSAASTDKEGALLG